MEDKIVFNKEMTEKLHVISLRVMELIYPEIEALNLNEREKIFAHYYVIKNYMDGIQRAMKDIGIDDIMVKKKMEQ